MKHLKLFLAILSVSLLTFSVAAQGVSPAASFQRGLLLFHQDQTEAALDQFALAVEADPNYVEALVYHGAALMVLGRLDEAESEIQRALNIDPNSALAVTFWARILSERGDHEAAMAEAFRAMDIDDTLSVVWHNLGILLLDAVPRDPLAARVAFDQAIVLDDTIAVYYMNRALAHHYSGNAEASVADYQRTFELYPHLTQAYINYAIMVREEGGYETAQSLLNQAASFDPDNPDVLLEMANLHSVTGRLDLALAQYETVLAVNPEESYAYLNRGLVYYRLGNLQQALNDLNRSIELDSSETNAFYNRAIIVAELGNIPAAIDDYTSAIELDPTNVRALFNRGQLYKDLADFQAAIDDFTRAIELAPDFDLPYFSRAEAYNALGDFESAKADYAYVTGDASYLESEGQVILAPPPP